MTPLSSEAAVGLQVLMVLGAGVASHRLLAVPATTRRIAGLLLATAFTIADFALLPPAPPGPEGATAAHVVAFFLSGSFFLGVTRLVRIGLVGLQPPQARSQSREPSDHKASVSAHVDDEVPRPPLGVYLAVYFTAPVALVSLQPNRQSRSTVLASPLRRAIFKAVLLLALLCLGVLPHAAVFSRHLLIAASTGNVVLYLLLSAIEDLACAMLEASYGVTMQPSFDAPWLATSTREFWARRWHTPFHEAFRAVTSRIPHRWASPGTAARLGFVFSGACHVGQVYIILRAFSPEMLLFFIAAAVIAGVEGPLLAALDRHVPYPSLRPWVRRGVVVMALNTTSLLFWLPFWRVNFLQAVARFYCWA